MSDIWNWIFFYSFLHFCRSLVFRSKYVVWVLILKFYLRVDVCYILFDFRLNLEYIKKIDFFILYIIYGLMVLIVLPHRFDEKYLNIVFLWFIVFKDFKYINQIFFMFFIYLEESIIINQPVACLVICFIYICGYHIFINHGRWFTETLYSLAICISNIYIISHTGLSIYISNFLYISIRIYFAGT